MLDADALELLLSSHPLEEDADCDGDMGQGGGPAYAARSVLNTRDEQQDAYVALDLLVEVRERARAAGG